MKRFLLISLISLLLGGSAFAQKHTSAEVAEQTMTLTGAIYDIQGSAIAQQAKVVAYDKAGRKFEAATDDEGFYQMPLPLAPYKMSALYKIEVTAPGFCVERLERYKIVDATHGKMSLDFVLEVCPSINTIQISDKQRPKRKSKSKPIANKFMRGN